MNQSLTQTEKIVGTVALSIIAGFFGIFWMINKATPIVKNVEGSKINYRMARPESPYSEYTLEGRELDQTYEGVPQATNQTTLKKSDNLKNKSVVAKKKDADKKQVEAKKQAEAKKSQQAAVVKKQAAQTKAVGLARKTANLSQNKKSRTNEVSDTSNSFVVFQNNSNNVAPAVEAGAPAKKKFSEWRTQIFASPTPEVLGQFIAAFRKGEITATEYQALAQDLIAQEDSKLKGLGLSALRSVPSLASLSQLVHAEEALPESYKVYVEEAYLAYFYSKNISIFSAALNTKDRLLQAKVLSLLSINLNKLSQGDQTVFVDARNLRANANVNFTLSSFETLLPALKLLAQDDEFSASALQISALIGTTNNVAQN